MRIYPLTETCTVIEMDIRVSPYMIKELNKVILRLIKEGVPEIRILFKD